MFSLERNFSEIRQNLTFAIIADMFFKKDRLHRLVALCFEREVIHLVL